jgi:hypothetical protein
MTNEQRAELRSFEGRRISLALTDGTRIDDCELVAADRHRVGKLWIYTQGTDAFVPVHEVSEVWESTHPGDHVTT